MAVESYEEDERDNKDDNSHTTEIELPPQFWPVREITDTLRVLRTTWLNLENNEAGERGDQGEEPG